MYEPTTQAYLNIAQKPRMKSHYRGHKMAVWLNLIPQLHQPGDEDVSMRHHHFHERASHFYSGTVRAESFTRIPSPMTTTLTATEATEECDKNTTEPVETESQDSPPQDSGVRPLKHHHRSRNAALGITVGVGCLLLVLNAVMFAGICYQRNRQKERATLTADEESPSHLSPSSPVPPPLSKKVNPVAKTSSAFPTGTIKKRVQIQEISV
uniref:Neuroligin n=1 Tax=Clastoptera arizonana TaxID=38151 RepID=A0A1B6CJ27_9HEMI